MFHIHCSGPGWNQRVVQCGYCQPGRIMNAAALLQENPQPTDAAIDAAMEGVPLTAPAMANAVFAATGKRTRHTPIRPEDLKAYG